MMEEQNKNSNQPGTPFHKRPLPDGLAFTLVIIALAALAIYAVIALNIMPFCCTVAQPSPAEQGLCIQVITPARNPATGEMKEFPTPCDVPTDWEKIN